MEYIKEAKIIGEFLEKSCGWEIRDTSRRCEKCGSLSFNVAANYCSRCGAKLPVYDDYYHFDKGIEQISEALSIAFGKGE